MDAKVVRWGVVAVVAVSVTFAFELPINFVACREILSFASLFSPFCIDDAQVSQFSDLKPRLRTSIRHLGTDRFWKILQPSSFPPLSRAPPQKVEKKFSTSLLSWGRGLLLSPPCQKKKPSAWKKLSFSKVSVKISNKNIRSIHPSPLLNPLVPVGSSSRRSLVVANYLKSSTLAEASAAWQFLARKAVNFCIAP